MFSQPPPQKNGFCTVYDKSTNTWTYSKNHMLERFFLGLERVQELLQIVENHRFDRDLEQDIDAMARGSRSSSVEDYVTKLLDLLHYFEGKVQGYTQRTNIYNGTDVYDLINYVTDLEIKVETIKDMLGI